mmetsp:Transcript_15233/g.57513  ORF Transcript_15233/g.57513 Transcript_15233/m.57513 type:complete len:411 (+) Transcript_15233:361-1593(+)
MPTGAAGTGSRRRRSPAAPWSKQTARTSTAQQWRRTRHASGTGTPSATCLPLLTRARGRQCCVWPCRPALTKSLRMWKPAHGKQPRRTRAPCAESSWRPATRARTCIPSPSSSDSLARSGFASRATRTRTLRSTVPSVSGAPRPQALARGWKATTTTPREPGVAHRSSSQKTPSASPPTDMGREGGTPRPSPGTSPARPPLASGASALSWRRQCAKRQLLRLPECAWGSKTQPRFWRVPLPAGPPRISLSRRRGRWHGASGRLLPAGTTCARLASGSRHSRQNTLPTTWRVPSRHRSARKPLPAMACSRRHQDRCPSMRRRVRSCCRDRRWKGYPAACSTSPSLQRLVWTSILTPLRSPPCRTSSCTEQAFRSRRRFGRRPESVQAAQTKPRTSCLAQLCGDSKARSTGA